MGRCLDGNVRDKGRVRFRCLGNSELGKKEVYVPGLSRSTLPRRLECRSQTSGIGRRGRSRSARWVSRSRDLSRPTSSKASPTRWRAAPQASSQAYKASGHFGWRSWAEESTVPVNQPFQPSAFDTAFPTSLTTGMSWRFALATDHRGKGTATLTAAVTLPWSSKMGAATEISPTKAS